MKDEKCAVCNEDIEHAYLPMKEWKIDGHLCGDCYSKKTGRVSILAIM